MPFDCLELKTMIAYNCEGRKYLSLSLIVRICWCATIVKNTVKRKEVCRRWIYCKFLMTSNKETSWHGSAPERSENATYKITDILQEVSELNNHLYDDPFLRKGTLTVSEILYNSPPRCVVAGMCAISIDRNLTDSETYRKASEEIREPPFVKKHNAEVTIYKYERFSYTKLAYPIGCYFTTWVASEDHPTTEASVEAYKGMHGNPIVGK